ncbi:MAG: M57 family metalloprotease [Saprospiraceae bacterium]|nr:zinc-dependent metalloprotease [Saprospiraceae bacterium]MDW8228274.1 M57 family metalloprotease [Saprospiraceae bacterium]
MLKRLLFIALAAVISVGIYSCVRDNGAEELLPTVPEDVKAKIARLGFSPKDTYAYEDGYVVEGDIFLRKQDLEADPSLSPNLIIAQEEQYRTFNLVTGLPRTIKISTSGTLTTNISNAIDIAISRYNAENLLLTFQRVNSGANIVIRIVNSGPFIASAGFPSGGNPYPEIQFNRQYGNWNVNTLATVFAHEIGHCIGFRHTDYMNRSYSCGTGGNEGQENTGVGAVHIPGTPTGPDPNSWMLACINNGINRPFNTNDRTALNYLY